MAPSWRGGSGDFYTTCHAFQNGGENGENDFTHSIQCDFFSSREREIFEMLKEGRKEGRKEEIISHTVYTV